MGRDRVPAVKGMHDIVPPETAKWRFIESTARTLLERYGYDDARTPALEYTHLFSRSIGAATDIVEKEMYTFEDRDGRSVTLRPEGTASIVRAYVEAASSKDPLTKWFYSGPMFRHERPQRGRMRQFHQIGAEALGLDSPSVDSELLTMCWRLIEELGVGRPQLLLSSLGCRNCRPAFRDKLVAFFGPKKDSLCENCQRRLETNPLRILDCKKDVEARKGAPSTLDILCEDCSGHFDVVKGDLQALGVPFTIDRTLVRGLDYYTRTTFEIQSTAEGMGSQNTLLGGGRYDRLVQELGGPDLPAIGFAMGIERMALAIAKEAAAFATGFDVFVVGLGGAARAWALTTCEKLRRSGLRAEIDHRFGSMKAQLRRADKLGAKVVLLAGDDELAKKVATLKVMSSSDQREVGDGEVVEAVRRTIG